MRDAPALCVFIGLLFAGGLLLDCGFAAGSDGSLYVSNWSIAPAVTSLGSVVRVTT